MLNEQSGQHFDPRCVQAFISQLEEARTIQARFTDE
jgi:response regulator RpfG family c-di-GMP phosphodiesterase